MKKIIQLLLFILVIIMMLCVGLSSAPAYADSPTATPTFRPIPPSPTSASLFLRPTPTLIVVAAVSLPPFETDAGSFADHVIGMYNYFNSDHIIDFLFCGIILFLIVKYLVRNIADPTRNQ